MRDEFLDFQCAKQLFRCLKECKEETIQILLKDVEAAHEATLACEQPAEIFAKLNINLKSGRDTYKLIICKYYACMRYDLYHKVRVYWK